MFKDRTGEKYITNQGYEVEIIEYIYNNNCTIKFNDLKSTVLKNINCKDLKTGSVRNPNHLSVYGVGYQGEGVYKTKILNKSTIFYERWKKMLQRSYDLACQERQPTYKDSSVDERWHNFQNFAEWMKNNYVEGWHLDKDILVKGNKIYSPETCCFVPQEINSLIIKSNGSRGNLPIGVCAVKNKFMAQLSTKEKHLFLGYFNTPKETFQAYKVAKEGYVKEVADKYKDLITPQTYQALINYQVEITD